MSKSLKEKVRFCLENYPDTRNDDRLLWASVVKNFYSDLIVDDMFIPIWNVPNLPPQDNVKRYRAWFQNDPIKPMYLPTDERVLKLRQDKSKAQQDFKVDLGYVNPAFSGRR